MPRRRATGPLRRWLPLGLLQAWAPPAAADQPDEIWPNAALRQTERRDDTERDLNPQLFGQWRAPDGRTITVAADGFVFREAKDKTERVAWLRHPYDWRWAEEVQASIAGGRRPGGIGPGHHIGYATPSVTDADIAHDIALAREFLRTDGRLDKAASHALETLAAAAAAIHKGTYRRVMRFCFDPPNPAFDCAPVDLLAYFILDGDRLIEIRLPLVAPEEGTIVAFTHIGLTSRGSS